LQLLIWEHYDSRITGSLCVRHPNGGLLRVTSLSLIDAPNGIEGPDARLIYLAFGDTQQEFLDFLRSALPGVQNITTTLEQAL
jgi:hypothetical protein